MKKNLSTLIILQSLILSLGIALADPVMDRVEQDLFSANFSQPSDLAQKDFAVGFKADSDKGPRVKVLQAPQPLTQQEKTPELVAAAKRLWNRDWAFHRMKDGKTDIAVLKNATPTMIKETQPKRLKEATLAYNQIITDIINSRKAHDLAKSLDPQKSVETPTGGCASPTGTNPLNGAAPANVGSATVGNVVKVLDVAVGNEQKTAEQKESANDAHDRLNVQPDASALNSEKSATPPLSLNATATRANGEAASDDQASRGSGIGSAPSSSASLVSNSPAAVAALPSSAVRVAPSFRSIVNVPGSASKLYAVSQDANGINLFTSNDGTTWNLVNKVGGISKQATQNIRAAVSQNSQDIVIGTDQGAFVSSDQGASFKQIGLVGSAAADVKVSQDGKQLLVGFKKGTPQGGTQDDMMIFNKTDAGWVAAAQQPTGLDDYSAKQFSGESTESHHRFSQNGVNVESVQIDPIHPGVLYAGTGNQLYRWDPSAQAWSIMSKGVLNDSTIYNIDVDARSGKLLVSSCNGVYEGDANNSSPTFSRIGDGHMLWRQGRNGDSGRPDGSGVDAEADPYAGVAVPTRSKTLRAYDVTSDPFDQNKIVATADTGVYVSKDAGKSWALIQGGDWQDNSVGKTASGVRTAAWMSDGSLVFSSENASYHVTP